MTCQATAGVSFTNTRYTYISLIYKCPQAGQKGKHAPFRIISRFKAGNICSLETEIMSVFPNL